MNLDAILTFVLAILSAGSTLFVANPAVVAILGHISQILALLGTAFHLDGVSLVGSTNTPVAGSATVTTTTASK